MSFPSPGSTMMFFLAAILDLIGLACLVLDFVGIGFGISFIPDLLGGVFLGSWLYFVRGDGMGFGGTSAKKLMGFTGGELIPALGDIAPFWTILVIMEILQD
ncbi:MAG: hypothetical protein V5A57_00915 [Candidatus Paceibacterota bacterium]